MRSFDATQVHQICDPVAQLDRARPTRTRDCNIKPYYNKNMLIGHCCKHLQPNGIEFPDCQIKSTTIAWLDRQSRDIAEKRLMDITVQNISAMSSLFRRVSELPINQRMVRIGSDVLPAYTHPNYKSFWQNSNTQKFLETQFSILGQQAKALNLRLSFHPGQFCCLVSNRPDVVDRSIEEFEYHVNLARWMGFGKTWHDHGFKINVHLSGKLGHGGFKSALDRMTVEARNLITIENDEMQAGLDDVLQVKHHCAIVLDLHHHWVRTGEYISPSDTRVAQVLESWRGVRPVLHFSVSREDVLNDHVVDELPNLQMLLQQKKTRSKLRAHSDYMWNHAVNKWALSFDRFDIQCESKAKNLASKDLAQYVAK